MIGILTFIGTQSHGACLQAYALKETVSSLGTDAEIINYISPEMKRVRDSRLPRPGSGIKKFLSDVKRYPFVKKRYKEFSAFERNYLGISDYKTTLDCSGFDRIIVGSDQVWNLELTGYDLNYFLKGCSSSDMKASYAASMGVSAFPEAYEEKCIQLINEFRFIGVREKQLGEYLKRKMPSKEIRTVLDPTLLPEKEFWNRLLGDAPLLKGDYILVHYPYDSEENRKLIRKAADELKARIVLITNQVKKRPGWDCLYAVSPLEYLNYIKYAKAVITGSFHTLSFSLVFEKDFYCTESAIPERNSRLSNLLETAGCEDMLLRNYPRSVPHGTVKERLEKSRRDSLEYLKNVCFL